MPRLPRPLAGSLLAGVLLAPALAAGTPAAATDLADPSQGQAATEGQPRPLMLVLDSSGSMAAPAPDGRSRMAVARDAVRRVAGRLPEGQELGLRVYGAEVFSRTDPGACTDSGVAVPIGTGTSAAVVDAVASMRPYGETPIGYALQQAAEDLRAAGRGEGSIVLVSDGEPTCDPDPCEVARSLGGADLRVDVVGLDVDATTRSSLSCIAEAAGGAYYDAADAADLTASLTVLTERAAQAYVATGTPVTGAASPIDAPAITAGTWMDEVAPTDPAGRYYRVRRQIPGSTLHISASVAQGADRSGITPLLTVSAPDARASCYLAPGSPSGGGVQAPAVIVGLGALTFGGPMTSDDECLGDELEIEVDWSEEPGSVRPDTTLELGVIEEPPVADPAAVPVVPRPADPPHNVMPAPAPTTPIVAVAGGESFAAATTLTPGRFRDSLVIGERRIYAVDLDWGQRLSVEVATPRGAEQIQEILTSPGVALSGSILGPGRSADTGGIMQGSSYSLGPRGVLTTRPVDWSNRALPPLEGGSALAGPHYLVLQLQDLEQADHPRYPIPVRFDIAVDGEPAPPPPYVEGGISFLKTTADEGDGPAGAPTAAARSDQDLASLGADAGVDDAGPSGSAVLVGLLLVGLGGGWLLARRRGPSSGGSGSRRHSSAGTVQAYAPSSSRIRR